MPEFNQQQYEAYLDAMLTANVPKELAEIASKIAASDDVTKPHLGRTSEDRAIVKQVVEHLKEWQREQQ